MLSLALMTAGWLIGARIGWALMDRWLTRHERRRMRNVTPGRWAS